MKKSSSAGLALLASWALTAPACGGTMHTDSSTCRYPYHWNGSVCVRTLNNGPNMGRMCPPGQHREDGGCLDNGQSNDD